MSDLSTREQIHAEATEVLARAGYDGVYGEWDTAPDHVRENWRRSMAPSVDALAAAGLLPTGTEDALAGGFQPGIHTFKDIENQSYPRVHTMRRYTHDWIEVPE